MAPLVKLAVISKQIENPLYWENWLVFLHLLYTVVEKQPYISCLLAPKNFLHKVLYSSCVSIFNGIYKIM